MKAIGKFILLELSEFSEWLSMQQVTRKITLIQQHHTYMPGYKQFKKNNHFELCMSMEKFHMERGFAEIAQHFTTFPDGTIMYGRNLNTIPAGIKGANTNGICIEHLGNFDKGGDNMTDAHRHTIIEMTKQLLKRFKLTACDQTVVYHHWYDLTLGKRIKKEGTGHTKSCPGTNFFGGNTVDDFNKNFLPLLLK
ncbi:MAG: N-acetylmuramoyl-L-alanine amidase [Cytophagaceae bacterium]|nr:N-acetylmuramoyl-L-alanine amidase [Cytophagaceae bacterium]MDW8456156.1 peptidoglycan recognition family protein [Cytophagaceae bacterium]